MLALPSGSFRLFAAISLVSFEWITNPHTERAFSAEPEKYEHGNWPLANQQMAESLAFADYDYKFVFGTGAHNGNHGGAIFPDSLRWLWRGWKDLTP